MPGFTLHIDWSANARSGSAPVASTRHLTLFADARIDNRQELAKSLDLSPTSSDAQFVLAAYEKWGDDSATHLIGDFCYAIWDARTRHVYAANDPMQMRTLYYMSSQQGLVVATEASAVLAAGGQTPVIDRLSLGTWLAGWPDPNRSMFVNAPRLPAGHWLHATCDTLRCRRFWDIDPGLRIRHRTTAAYSEHLEQVLKRCVADRLRTSAPRIAAQLSGGMDSTTVCAMAEELLRESETKLTTLSHAYPEDAACDEATLIRATLDRLGIDDHHTLAVDARNDLSFARLYPPVMDSPGTVASPRYIDELLRVRTLGAGVLLTGSGGDEMVWGHSLSYPQRLREGDLAVIGEVMRGSRQLGLPMWRTVWNLLITPLLPDALKHNVRRLLGRTPASMLPAWIPSSAARDLDLQAYLSAPRGATFDNPALQARYDALRETSTINAVRSYQHVADDAGIEVRHPFFDRRLAEFSFAIPHAMWIRQRYPKWLLRITMQNRLPDAVVWNPHKVTFNRFFGRLIGQHQNEVRQLLADRRLEDLGLLDTREVLHAFDQVVESKGERMRVDLLYALLTQTWLQQFDDTVGIS